MKFCPNCGAELPEGALACPSCGASFASAAPAAPANPWDHTAEYDPADISENKVMAMLPYAVGILGVIVAMLARSDSPYTDFQVRQYLKLLVCKFVVGVISAVLCFTFIVPIAGCICLAILFVIQVICFVRVCLGKAVEAPIVRNLGFLK